MGERDGETVVQGNGRMGEAEDVGEMRREDEKEVGWVSE